MPSRPRGHFGIARSVRLFVRQSVPWRSCLGYRHAGCLQLSHRRPPEICGLRNRPRTDVDPSRFLIGDETILHRRTAIGKGAYRLAPPPGGAIPCYYYNYYYTVQCELQVRRQGGWRLLRQSVQPITPSDRRRWWRPRRPFSDNTLPPPTRPTAPPVSTSSCGFYRTTLCTLISSPRFVSDPFHIFRV